MQSYQCMILLAKKTIGRGKKSTHMNKRQSKYPIVAK